MPDTSDTPRLPLWRGHNETLPKEMSQASPLQLSVFDSPPQYHDNRSPLQVATCGPVSISTYPVQCALRIGLPQ